MGKHSFLVVEVYSQTASFRNPEFQNFHKTLMLPPPTTVFGIAGAAMGLGPKATQDYFDQNEWSMGIYGRSFGKGKDLWKYRTLNFEKQKKSLGLKKEQELDLRNDDPKSIINRELLFQNRFVFVFGNENRQVLEDLLNAFLSPTYALTVGNSDSLAKIVHIDMLSELTTSRKVEYCLIEGDIVASVMDKAIEDPVFSIYSTSDPITYDLPTRFTYKQEYGIRSVSDRKTFSMIGEPMDINIDITGVTYQDTFVPVFSIH